MILALPPFCAVLLKAVITLALCIQFQSLAISQAAPYICPRGGYHTDGTLCLGKCDVQNKHWIAMTSTWTAVCAVNLGWTCGEHTQQSRVVDQHVNNNTHACKDIYTHTDNMRYTQLSPAGVVHGSLSLEKKQTRVWLACKLYTTSGASQASGLAHWSLYVAGGSTLML